jgi:aminopeptidase-like protein
MSVFSFQKTQKKEVGEKLYQLIERLYPICRSITGDGVRQTLNVLKEFIPLEVHEVKSGTKVFDWVVPDEWNINDGYILNREGEKIIDFKKLNLHVLNYSIPIDEDVDLSDLKEHVYTLPDHPDWVPYRTSYHNKNWGFCMSQNQLDDLPEGKYRVKVDSTLEPGSLTYGEYYVKGETTDEVLISCHICHPSLCNDNLSGITIATLLAQMLSKTSLKYSYRFLFIPGTIGSITWLSRNEDKLQNIKHGLVLTLLGDSGKFHYKKSRKGNTEIDRVVERILKEEYDESEIIEFYPYGYDERQFCSPGFDLPIGRLSRTPHGEFPEYHTSADNLDFVKPLFLAESFQLILNIFNELETAEKYMNLNPKCEPQLGKRGLFKAIGGQSKAKDYQMALLWMLNLSDGTYSVEDIAKKSGLSKETLKEATDALLNVNLLSKL